MNSNIYFITLVSFVVAVFSPLLFLIISVINRIYSTLRGIFNDPIGSFKEIPRNWIKNALSVDLYFPPEITPGENSRKHSYPPIWKGHIYHGINLSRDFEYAEGPFETILEIISAFLVTVVFIIPGFIFGYIPAIIMRISFKASSIFYIPMIYLSRTTIGRTSGLLVWLQDILEGSWEKGRRWLASITLTLAFGKSALVFGQIKLSGLPKYAQDILFLNNIFQDKSWHIWQILWTFDGILTFLILGISSPVKIRLDNNVSLPERNIVSALSILTIVRGVVAIGAILTTFNLALWAVVEAVLLR